MDRGIIIPAIEAYEHLLLHNIETLRNLLKCELPIEIWQIGQEISDDAQNFLTSKQVEWNLSFKNVYNYTDDPGHWQGYQIKAFIMKHTTFDEVILFDCDSLFLQDPTIIFDDPNYIETGTFFFKDYLRHTPDCMEEELGRIKWFQRMMPFRSPYLPKECYYLYDLPIETQQYWFYQESGMVYLNRKRHPKVVETIYQLNNNHKETYQYVHGDKETFWIACLLCNIPFHMNNYPAINLYPDIEKPMTYDKMPYGPSLAHIYKKGGDTLLFYSQKAYPDSKKISKEIILKQLE